MDKHKLARQAVDEEILHARTGRNHPSVRVVTLERVLAIADAKTEALKGIHRICNRLLHDDELTDLDIPTLVKQIRDIASATWPAIAPITRHPINAPSTPHQTPPEANLSDVSHTSSVAGGGE